MGFEADLKKFAKEVNESIKEITKETSFIVFRDITGNTAVDEGTLKASLQIKGESPDLTTVAPKGSTFVSVPSLGPLKDNPTIFITNNQPYAQRILNEGWSGQTEENMASEALQRAFLALKQKYGT